jgi:TonB family protein
MNNKKRDFYFAKVLVFSLFFACLNNVAAAVPSKESAQNHVASMQEYWGAVQAKIRAHWKVPDTPMAVAPKVRFKILPNGQVTDVDVYRSAGNIGIDTSVVEAVNKAAPFPKITTPPYNKRGLYVEMNFSDNQGQSKEELNQLVSQANRSLEAGNWQLAAILLTRALKSDPNNQTVKSELSGIYLNQASMLAASDPASKEARMLAKRAYSLDPHNEGARKLMQGH